ncbi:hypothetical protein BJX96DRAFT_171800 [Aspergillus floccosus]
MDRVKTLFSGCIQARKRSKAQYHDSWLASAPAYCTHHQPSTPQQPAQKDPKPLSKTSSIRIVESDPDDESDHGPERRLRLSRFVPDEPADDPDEESLHASDSDLYGTDEPQALPQPRTWTNHALTAEVKRRIEDIPEEDEGDERADMSVAPALAQKQSHPRRRKSLVEIIQLLQSTTTAIKGAYPGLPGKATLRGTATAGAGSSTASLPSLASSLSTHDTDSDDEVKRQRRVGAIVFPAAMRLRGWTDGRKKRPVTMAAVAGEEKSVFC